MIAPMTRLRLLLVLVVLLLIGAGAGAWWYLFAAPKIDAAELVPSDTVAFATIPNGASVLAGYQSSHLKALVDSPNAHPVIDLLQHWIGEKNADLFQAFLPNLSGQSFMAITHLDADHPEQAGFIAAMKPKAGLGDFDGFVEKLKAAWPDLLKQGTTGTGNVAGFDYQWIQGPGGANKICVAHIHGWIVTTWGEAPLQDWIARYQKTSTTPSLAQNAEYQKVVSQLGKDPLGVAYIDYHTGIDFLQKQASAGNGSLANYLSERASGTGAAAFGTWFENGDIVDRFSIPVPHQAQADSGLGATPCAFETLQFSGHETLFYWASSINWSQYWKNLQANAERSPSLYPLSTYAVHFLQGWTQSVGLDIQHNILDLLGSEVSIQGEWNTDSKYPELGLLVKLAKPDDFKPVIRAIIESTRKAYEDSAVIKEVNANNHNFAVLTFIPDSPISPTVTEDGNYLGFFLTANQAVRSFARDPQVTVAQNDGFVQQVGDKRNGASQLVFIDSPRLLDRAYRNVTPYLSLASMFNRDLANALKGQTLPEDLTWAAPVGTWSFVLTPDDTGVHGFSVSGVGNQGVYYAYASQFVLPVAESMGWVPKISALKVPAFVPLVTPSPAPAATLPDTATNAPPAPDATNAAPLPATLPDASTNAAPTTPDAPKPQ